MSEEDLELWLDAMDGKEPVYERPLRPSDASQTFLDEAGFNFIQRCIQVLEYRGESRTCLLNSRSDLVLSIYFGTFLTQGVEKKISAKFLHRRWGK